GWGGVGSSKVGVLESSVVYILVEKLRNVTGSEGWELGGGVCFEEEVLEYWRTDFGRGDAILTRGSGMEADV
ncbi:MAG: hypothetical protein JWM47_4107, partial [Acidimicrobiales bacterium]|nr:hypothetical protein [Acidimicrobiales bacterium]